MKSILRIGLSLAAAALFASCSGFGDSDDTESAPQPSANRTAAICHNAIESFLESANVRSFTKQYAEEAGDPDAVPLMFSEWFLSRIREKDPVAAELTEMFSLELLNMNKVMLDRSLHLPENESPETSIRIAGTLPAPRLSLNVYGHSDAKTDQEHPGEPKERYFFEIDDLHTGLILWMSSRKLEGNGKSASKKQDKIAALFDDAVLRFLNTAACDLVASPEFLTLLKKKQGDQDKLVLGFQKPVNRSSIPDWKISEYMDLLTESLIQSPSAAVTRAEGAARRSALVTMRDRYERDDNYASETRPKPGSLQAADLWIVMKVNSASAGDKESGIYSFEIHVVDKKNGNLVFNRAFEISK